jgi:nucleoid DNA-binding protein
MRPFMALISKAELIETISKILGEGKAIEIRGFGSFYL